jgi:hypothetical protein
VGDAVKGILEELYYMFCDLVDTLWVGAMLGVKLSVAIVVIFWTLRGLSGYASALRGLVQ